MFPHLTVQNAKEKSKMLQLKEHFCLQESRQASLNNSRVAFPLTHPRTNQSGIPDLRSKRNHTSEPMVKSLPSPNVHVSNYEAPAFISSPVGCPEVSPETVKLQIPPNLAQAYLLQTGPGQPIQGAELAAKHNG